MIKDRVDQFIDKKPSGEKAHWKKMLTEELRSPSETTTGFVVGESTTDIVILTCAHSLQVCFDKLNPISASEVNRLYTISVQCDHGELHHRKNRQISRVYSPAIVLQVNSSKDLLLLQVSKGFLQRGSPGTQISK